MNFRDNPSRTPNHLLTFHVWVNFVAMKRNLVDFGVILTHMPSQAGKYLAYGHFRRFTRNGSLIFLKYLPGQFMAYFLFPTVVSVLTDFRNLI
ncbi:hypothetical protein CEXT_700491 [Caerostris extrusa]|uniref:Uncharacterized protein n=1 Tax=Caerostris extrusa TaxID=172846 RepID=A0AAV4RZG4_CAEEX|nr:hypothetical protein CEXT_700491 [Caerostris extrusa]